MMMEEQMRSGWSSVGPSPQVEQQCGFSVGPSPQVAQECGLERSLVTDARVRLDHLKSVCGSTNQSLHQYNHSTDQWSSEGGSVLDLIHILDVQDQEWDEESWLYELPVSRVSCVEQNVSALSWCRHVLDNPSPEMLAARRALTRKLDKETMKFCYKVPSLCDAQRNCRVEQPQQTCDGPVLAPITSCDVSGRTFRMQNIRDVHAVAQIQEASLRQDSVSLPSSPSPLRRPKPSLIIHTDHSGSAPSLSSSQKPGSAPSTGCQSPRLARIQQQVTQFKLFKLAQSGGSSPVRTRSPLRTSLRSLQAVRNSRSLDTPEDDGSMFDQSPAVWAHPPQSVKSPSCTSSVRTALLKTLQRSQSLSPCRVPQWNRDQDQRKKLSVHGRVHASPDIQTITAWSTNRTSIYR